MLAFNVASFFIFCVLLVVPHEFAHAVCAWIVDWRVCKISLGLGRTLKQFRFAGLNFEINLSLGGGVTWIAPKETKWARLKYFLVISAGPIVHLLLLAAVLFGQSWTGSLDDWQREPTPLATLAAANLLMLGVALLPYKHLVTCGQFAVWLPSDGLAMLTAPFLSERTIRQWHAYYFAFEAADHWLQGDYRAAKQWNERGLEFYPDDLNNRMGLGLALCFLHDLRGGRDQWILVLNRTDLPNEIRLLMLNNIAWNDLMLGDASLLDEADRFSREAVAGAPTQPPYLGTRGSVLIERGDLDEGLRLVEQAYDGNEDSRLKALNACYLALGESKRGNQAKSQSYLDLARRLHPECMLLAKTATRLQEA